MQEPAASREALYRLVVHHGIVVFLLIYLVFGVIFAFENLSQDRRTFTCLDPDAPHGTIGGTVWTYENPDPSRCAPEHSTLNLAGRFLFNVVLGPAIFTMFVLHGGDQTPETLPAPGE
jgi:hypothetical protein